MCKMRFLILGFLLCVPVAAFIDMTISGEVGLTNTGPGKQDSHYTNTHSNGGERFHHGVTEPVVKDTVRAHIPEILSNTKSTVKQGQQSNTAEHTERYGSTRYDHHMQVSQNKDKDTTQTGRLNVPEHMNSTESSFKNRRITDEGKRKHRHGSTRYHHHVTVSENKDTIATEHSNVPDSMSSSESALNNKTGEGSDKQHYDSARYQHQVRVSANKDTTPTEHSDVLSHISKTHTKFKHKQRTDKGTDTQLQGSSRYHYQVTVSANKDTTQREHHGVADHTSRTNSNVTHIHRTDKGTDTESHGSSRYHHRVKESGNKEKTPNEHFNAPGHSSSPEPTFKKSHKNNEHKHRHGHGQTTHRHQVAASKSIVSTQNEREDIQIYKSKAKSTNTNKTHSDEGMQTHQHTVSNNGDTAHNVTGALSNAKHNNVEVREKSRRVNNRGRHTDDHIMSGLDLQSSTAMETVARWSVVWLCLVLCNVS